MNIFHRIKRFVNLISTFNLSVCLSVCFEIDQHVCGDLGMYIDIREEFWNTLKKLIQPKLGKTIQNLGSQIERARILAHQ
jgi:hypothetical protein